MKLSLGAARHLLLAAQGLLRRPDRAAQSAEVQKADVHAAIRRMGALQIDTISVVARSHELVLWSRLGAYDPRRLYELLAEGAIFEYWSHAACFLPREDFGLYRRLMTDGRDRWRAWMAEHPELVERVLARVRDGEPVRSAEFERTDGRSAGWWDWKPEKQALEQLYNSGVLMVCRRDANFHRYYDLRQRVFPDWDDARTPPAEAARRALIVKAVRALGVATPRWVPDYFKLASKGTASILEALADEGVLSRAEIEGIAGPAYIYADSLPAAASAAGGEGPPQLTTLLSPFDPLVWDRARALALFGFTYRIETYTPAAARRYGYFSLPILHRGALVGRLDPKAYRKEGRFVVRAVHLEPDVPVADDLVVGLAGALAECAVWHGTPEVLIQESSPPILARALAEQLRSHTL